jgi:transcriptional regulator with XRE-family HTH domain
MSQKQFARCLGVAEATLSRWLSETQIQSRAMDNLLRAFLAFPQVRAFLGGEIQDPQLGFSEAVGGFSPGGEKGAKAAGR